MLSFLKSNVKFLSLLVLALLITTAYIPTFSGKFILDDRPLVKDNPFIKEFNKPTFYLSHEDGVSNKELPGSHTGYYRPLVNVFYTLDYKMWGMNPSGFRVTNLILHILTCIILFQFLSTLVGGRFIPFAATLLFGLHPVNTESVAWISSRNNILVTLFSLISFYYYIKHRKDRMIVYGILSYFSFVVALLCKEFAVMLFPIFFLYNRIMGNDKKAIKNEMLGYIPFILIFFFYFIFRSNAIGSVLTPVSTAHIWKNLYFVPFLILYNLKLILIPYNLHSFIIQYPDNYLSWKAFAGFIGLAALVLFLLKERKNTILLFSIIAFLVALFPILNLLHTSAVTKVSMRWLYFPMTFLSFSSIWYFQKLIKLNRFIIMLGLSTIIIYFGTYSYILNQSLWHDEDTFFRQEVLHFDNNYYVGGFAERLFEKENYKEAELYFRIAINKYPRDAKNYINYSALLINTCRAPDALEYLKRVRKLTFTHSERGQWHNNLGMAYFNLGKKNDALTSFRKAIIFSPKEPQFWANLGGAYGAIGDYKNSIYALKKGLEISPESIQLRQNLGVSYFRAGCYEEAISVFEKIPLQTRERERSISMLLKKSYQMLNSPFWP